MTSRHVAYVDSADEQLAFLLSTFGAQSTWRIDEQRMANREGESVELAMIETADGLAEVEFRDAHPASFTQPAELDRTDALDPLMERASTFAAENPPHHPGSLPRFPIPVEHYNRAVGVPLPILAVDDLGRRGLYAPPRMVVVSWDTTDPIGVREFDDFDPANWPASTIAERSPDVLQATIQRFSACWSRAIDAWFSGEDGNERRGLGADIGDALRLRGVLDLPAMDDVYRSMNPAFDQWLRQMATTARR